MGKPTSPMPRPPGDAMSLHTQPGDRFLDDDAPELQVDDLPPLYDDAIDPSNSSSAPLLGAPEAYPPALNAAIYQQIAPQSTDNNTEWYMDTRLDNDAKLLAQYVESWALTPPRPFVRVYGSHSQQVEDRDGKKERRAITDFDVQVELTPYLYSDATNRMSFRELRTVDNFEKARRGTVFACRAPGARASLEVGLPEKPTLMEWCHRYCASHAGLKQFTLRRRMVGFDEAKVREKLTALVRGTHYHGSLQITFPTQNEEVSVYNECKFNLWRAKTWLRWVCYLTFMWVFIWPYLLLRTKKFEVVVAEWPFSVPAEGGRKKYASISEDQWYNMWGRAINRAVLEKRQTILDQQDLLASQGAEPVFSSAMGDGAMGLLRAGVSAMNEVNRQLGWGYDS